jgi:hypothetical protein
MKKRMSLQDKAMEALQEAVQEVVRDHNKNGRPLSVWKNGKAVRVSPRSLRIVK